MKNVGLFIPVPKGRFNIKIKIRYDKKTKTAAEKQNGDWFVLFAKIFWISLGRFFLSLKNAVAAVTSN